MGFFANLFSRLKSSGTEQLLIAKLNEIAEAYDLSLHNHQTTLPILDKCFTDRCRRQWLQLLNNSERIRIGFLQHMNREWERQDSVTFLCHITYNDMKIGAGVLATFGDPYDEVWTLTEDNTQVDCIQRLDPDY